MYVVVLDSNSNKPRKPNFNEFESETSCKPGEGPQSEAAAAVLPGLVDAVVAAVGDVVPAQPSSLWEALTVQPMEGPYLNLR